MGFKRSQVRILAPRLELRRHCSGVAENLAEKSPGQRQLTGGQSGPFSPLLAIGGFKLEGPHMHTPKPFYRRFNDSWYVQIGKRQIQLAKGKANEEAAYRRFYQVMAQEDPTRLLASPDT